MAGVFRNTHSHMSIRVRRYNNSTSKC